MKQYQLSKLLRDGGGSSGCRSVNSPQSYCRGLHCRLSAPPTPPILLSPREGCTFPSSLVVHRQLRRVITASYVMGLKLLFPHVSCAKQEDHFLTEHNLIGTGQTVHLDSMSVSWKWEYVFPFYLLGQ